MKVLITSGDLNRGGGVVNYVRLLINNLENKNPKVEHFSHGLKSEHHNDLIVPIIWIYKFIKFFMDLGYEKPDIIHLNSSLNKGSLIRDIIFLKISHIKGFPILFFIHGWNWTLYEKIKKNDLLRKIFVKSLKKADKILVLSQDFREALVEIGIDEDKIGLTSTMVESDSYLPENKTYNDPYNILFCSRIIKDKGPYELIDAIPQIIENEEDVNFIFVGDGSALENLKRKAKEMGIEEYVTFTGYTTGEEKYDIYKKSHLFVLPSYTEGFPNVALEAMAAGLPIIASPVGALKYAIKDRKNGCKLEFVPPEPESLAKKITELIENPDLMKEMSEYNLQEAKSKYDVEAVTEQIERIYEEFVEDLE